MSQVRDWFKDDFARTYAILPDDATLEEKVDAALLAFATSRHVRERLQTAITRNEQLSGGGYASDLSQVVRRALTDLFTESE